MEHVSVAACQSAFAEFDCTDDKVWDSAVGLAEQLQLAPAELSEKYELFCVNKCASASDADCHEDV